MGHIIAVSGVGNSGKTTSIKETYRLLDNHLRREFGVKIKIEIIHERRYTNDIVIVVKITIGNAVIIIIITSAGDVEEFLLTAMKRFKKYKCNIMVCATKSRGSTVEILNKWEKVHTVHRIPKHKAASLSIQKEENIATAEKIIQHLVKVIRSDYL